jgi:DNA-binding transcriptional regulator YiaG
VNVPIRRYRKDPRTTAERNADEKVLQRFERGDFLKIDPAIEQEAAERVQSRHQARRDTVAALGKELGILRRAHRLTQEQVALALCTKKSNVSRLESGQYGGLTIEYFLAVLDAFRTLDQSRRKRGRPDSSVVSRRKIKHSHIEKPQIKAA